MNKKELKELKKRMFNGEVNGMIIPTKSRTKHEMFLDWKAKQEAQFDEWCKLEKLSIEEKEELKRRIYLEAKRDNNDEDKG